MPRVGGIWYLVLYVDYSSGIVAAVILLGSDSDTYREHLPTVLYHTILGNYLYSSYEYLYTF